MRFPFFKSRRDDGPTTLALPEFVEIHFGVLFRAEGEAAPEAEALRSIVQTWLDAHAEEPLGPHLKRAVTKRLVTLVVLPIDEAPLPPASLLGAFGIDQEQRIRRERATHMVLVGCLDKLRPPRFGLWLAVAAMRALVEALDGVAIDPPFPRLLPISMAGEDIPADGRVAVAQHIIVPFSVNEQGKGWMTTAGMQKFGLPNLEIRDVPPDLADGLMPFANAIAQTLVDLSMRQASEREEPLTTFEVGPEIKVGLAQIARAFGVEELEPEEGVRGWTLVRIGLERPRRGQERMIQVLPPRAFPGDQGVWLNSVLSDLRKSKRSVRGIAPGNEAMEDAHRRAMADLPGTKRRFQEGLEPGAKLFVKHAFPLEKGGNEYMWVIVNTWQSDRLRGQLASDPEFRLDLRAGQSVELRDADVFDWLLSHPDGRLEGGYTNQPLNEEGVELLDDDGADDD